VLEDADVVKAAEIGVVSRYTNNGEGCICAKRFLVAEPLFDTFMRTFVEASKSHPMGDPMKEGIKLGPLAHADVRANLHRQVLDAVKAGARVLTGGEIPAGPGNFYPPTVLSGLPPEAAVLQEEFFGPVALMFSFKTEKEAIRLANGTPASRLRASGVNWARLERWNSPTPNWCGRANESQQVSPRVGP
jgi:acyl-CoA reductase-like NAD-dependent aldehyde dehydrogenase